VIKLCQTLLCIFKLVDDLIYC